MRKIVSLIVCFSIFLAVGTNPANATLVVKPAVTIQPVNEPDPASIKNAVDEFKSLSKKERKLRIKAAKKEIRDYKKQKKDGGATDTNTLLLVILGILLPPLAVYLYEGEINNRFWIDLILTLLGWLPGVVYALVLILGEY